MQSPIQTIEYKGHNIEIYQDEPIESPNDWGNTDVFLVGYHRDFTVERNNIITKSTAQNLFTDRKELDAEDREAVDAIKKQYHVFGLEAYIHSGVSLALVKEGSFPDRQWDVSMLGAVFVEKTQARTRKKAHTIAEGLIKTWNQYLSGEIYGYIAKDKNGEEIDSCWGYYGNPEESGLLESARGEIDAHVETEERKREQKTKAYITHNVPIMARV